jgi:hypothetical protein
LDVISLGVASIMAHKVLFSDKEIDDLSKAKTPQEVAASQIKILNLYYNNVLIQSQRSFLFALIAACIGLLFFIISAAKYNAGEMALMTALGGSLSGFISAINFYLYNKSSSQLAEFHQRLDVTQRFLLADGLCNAIIDEGKKDDARRDLMNTISGIYIKTEIEKINTAPKS